MWKDKVENLGKFAKMKVRMSHTVELNCHLQIKKWKNFRQI